VFVRGGIIKPDQKFGGDQETERGSSDRLEMGIRGVRRRVASEVKRSVQVEEKQQKILTPMGMHTYKKKVHNQLYLAYKKGS